MNRRERALKGSKGQRNFRKKLLRLIVSVLGVLIMPFLVVFQLIILIRQSFSRIKGGFISLGVLLLAAVSFLAEPLSTADEKKAMSSKT